MPNICYSENRPAVCNSCGAHNMVRVAHAPGPAEEWFDVNCAACGAELSPREKQGLIVVELAEDRSA